MYRFSGSRAMVRERATTAAMQLIRAQLGTGPQHLTP